jgi:hypothetical protein
MAFGKSYRFIDEITHFEGLKPVTLGEGSSLSFLACECVPNKGDFKSEMLRHLRPHLVASGIKVKMNDLLNCIS